VWNRFDPYTTHTIYVISMQPGGMNFRLEGPTIEHKVRTDIVSDTIQPGAVKVTRSGLPIILLANRQTICGDVDLMVTQNI